MWPVSWAITHSGSLGSSIRADMTYIITPTLSQLTSGCGSSSLNHTAVSSVDNTTPTGTLKHKTETSVHYTINNLNIQTKNYR